MITVKLFIKRRGEKRLSPSDCETTLDYLFLRERYCLEAGGKKPLYLQTAITAYSCSQTPEKFHCRL